jgi:DNA-directed RNA polymerase subunit alpha
MMLLEPIQMPEKVETEESTYSSTYGKFEIGPLEPGFATTIGNTLRRVLLSAIQGAAVRYVKIEGLHHEFTPVPHSDSDYIDVILRLKNLILKCDSVNEERIVLEHKGKGPVTAADILERAGIEIINKDLFLLNLVDDVDFTMEIWVGVGRGYVPADDHNVEERPVGVIPVDSIYSPVTKVNFLTGHQRVGEKIDFDKLTVEVWTDGSIDPRDSLYLSAKILRDLYSTIVRFEKEPEYVEEVEMDPELERLQKLFTMNVKELELTVRSSNCLSAAKIETIGELCAKSENEMLKYRNFGKKSLDEINSLLTNYNLSLGMDVDGIMRRIEEAQRKVTAKKKG